MLVLSRLAGERIRIGEDVWVSVQRIDHLNGQARVSLGITAPKDVVITREELIEKMPRTEGGGR